MARRFRKYSGMSLVELLVAVALLGMVSVAALQFMRARLDCVFRPHRLLDHCALRANAPCQRPVPLRPIVFV